MAKTINDIDRSDKAAYIQALENALIECFDAAIPQAHPWPGSPDEKARYAAIVLPSHLRGLNRLLAHKSEELRKLNAEAPEQSAA